MDEVAARDNSAASLAPSPAGLQKRNLAEPKPVPVHGLQSFDLGVRVVSRDLRTLKVFTGRNAFEMDSQASFDSTHVTVSAAEYFLGSLSGSMALSILEQARREHLDIEDIEVKLRGSIEHPLALLGVRGYEQQRPALARLEIDFFLYADVDEDVLEEFCLRALERSLVYNSVKESLAITIRFKPLI
jgi:uncharacterized OsmC-like protein